MADYKWTRPNNAAVLRSDYFVKQFIEQNSYVPSHQEFASLVRWKPGMEAEGARWLNECYRDTVGHLEIPLENPGLFETLDNQKIDVILMDNLHDTNGALLYRKGDAKGPTFEIPFSMSRCENEHDLQREFDYRAPLTAEQSYANWVRIIEFVRMKQPAAHIIFFCSHTSTMRAQPERMKRAQDFYALLEPMADKLGITVVAPIELPPHLTKMPEDTDHFQLPVYRAMAGTIFLAYAATQTTQGAQ